LAVERKTILICAVQVPFVRGGAEEHVEGLERALREAGHDVAMVWLPFKWYPKPEIIKGVLAWRALDLSECNGRKVDLAVCTKFPSWAVRHPNKVTWLIHQFRQAYDWYGTPLGLGHEADDVRLKQLITTIDRRMLGESKRIYSNSRNTAGRLARFNGLEATPLYPPLKHDNFRSGEYGDYILSVGRLDRAKRADLLIKAMKHVRSGARGLIAGDGPDREALAKLITDLGLGDRVELLGRISDERLIELYSGALGVYYAPVDEDFGYITIEAFRSKRPVVTTPDSGGVLEFVENGQSGLIVNVDPVEVAAAIDRLYADRALCASLGEEGFRRTPRETWADIARIIVEGP
jgi:glycosyltransferase involved in cell wall biosynthesis